MHIRKQTKKGVQLPLEVTREQKHKVENKLREKTGEVLVHLALRHKAHHSHATSAEVKNGGSIQPPPHVFSWHGTKLSMGTALHFKLKTELNSMA
jgi:4-hydroxyphenylpyruvate dioxygenase-like putative hemolysin